MNKFVCVSAALAVSLGLNIFGLGVITGHHFGASGFIPGHEMPPSPMGAPQEMLAHMERVLPPGDVLPFDEQMRANLLFPNDKNMASSFKAIRDALAAPNFSPDAFRQALQHVHDQREDMDKHFVEAFVKAVSKISPEGRLKLADALPDHTRDRDADRERGPDMDLPPPPEQR
jgi:hypothetical protein